MEKKCTYITTTIPYVNAEPHIGFALEAVQADALARYKRLMGHEVFLNAGADEHGQKIWEKAQSEGVEVQAYVDGFAQKVQELRDLLNLSYNNFIRTSSPEHRKAAEEMWKRCEAKGDIYKKKYKAPYCVGCEKFLSARDLDENGECPFHPGKKPIELEEENYFFKFSNYQKTLEDYLARASVIIPEHRLREAQQFVASGIEDFSISREKEKLPWGVPVPGDDSQVMYVWFDALTCYISTLGWPDDEQGMFKKFWQEESEIIQMAGKDQVRFQSIIWPAMLSSAGIKVPDQIFYHGFINSGGQRMSKSLGNIISPKDLVAKYGTDATRYILLRHMHPTDDTDITWEKMDEWYTANLVNGLGNLVARVMKMSESYGVSCPDFADRDFFSGDELREFAFADVMDSIWRDIQHLDEYIQREEPFKKIKVDEDAAKKDVSVLLVHLRAIGAKLEPFMPTTSQIITEAVKVNKKPENLFNRLTT